MRCRKKEIQAKLENMPKTIADYRVSLPSLQAGITAAITEKSLWNAFDFRMHKVGDGSTGLGSI
jgi:hypothetical protein